ncbi:MAG: HAD family hydrolase [Acidobacteriota bacterium]
MILDVDGTLVDSNDAHAQACVGAFAGHRITVPFDAVRRAIGMGGDKLMPIVAGIDAASSLGEQISARRGEIFKRDFLPSIRAFPGARELLQRCAQHGLVLAIASSAKEDELHALLDIAGLSDLLALRTSSDDAEESKPDPDIVAAALKQTGCAPDRAVMIGDTPYDVEAALRAGIRVVGFECGGWKREDLRGAIEVHAGPAALLERYDTSIVGRLAQQSTSPSGS